MRSFDFEYDGRDLSSFGYTICKFGSDGLETISNGSQITFNTVSTHHGEKHGLISSEYEDCLETTFQICKNPCGEDHMEISVDEVRIISSWLNRKGFHKFKVLSGEYMDLYFEATFNISTIQMNNKIYGFELECKTNRPFALMEDVVLKVDDWGAGETIGVKNRSDVEGYIYPEMQITLKESGDFVLYNEIEDRTTEIKNCVAGEVITFNYPIVETSVASHAIQNDFNWTFPRLSCTYSQKMNKITSSLGCAMRIVYTPYVKVGL